MRAAGATAFLETGPGDILTGLARRTLGEDVESRTLAEGVEAALAAASEESRRPDPAQETADA